MNIVLYVNSFLPAIGGREIVVHQLANAFTAMGHKARVVTHGGFWSNRKLKFNYPVHRYPSLRGCFNRTRGQQLFIDTVLRGCDVIHAHATYPAAYTAARLKRLSGIPLVVTPHGSDIHTIPERNYGLRLNPHLAPKIRYALENSDMITAISDSIENSILDAGGDKKKIKKVPNGVDINRFQNKVDVDVRKLLNLPHDSRLILTVGNYRPVKGHEILVRSMVRILTREPRARLVIVGKNTEKLTPLITGLNLKDKIRLTGQLKFPIYNTPENSSREKDILSAIYQNSNIYVSAGIQEGAEGLSLSVLDAMAAGVPIVATDISGNRDLISNHKTGIVIKANNAGEIADAVLKIISDNNVKHRIVENALKSIRRYDWMEISGRYVKIFEEIS